METWSYMNLKTSIYCIHFLRFNRFLLLLLGDHISVLPYLLARSYLVWFSITVVSSQKNDIMMDILLAFISVFASDVLGGSSIKLIFDSVRTQTFSCGSGISGRNTLTMLFSLFWYRAASMPWVCTFCGCFNSKQQNRKIVSSR